LGVRASRGGKSKEVCRSERWVGGKKPKCNWPSKKAYEGKEERDFISWQRGVGRGKREKGKGGPLRSPQSGCRTPETGWNLRGAHQYVLAGGLRKRGDLKGGIQAKGV